jgi:TetR/AcrR family transcriptional regulator, transcriptional repressor for nem operon
MRYDPDHKQNTHNAIVRDASQRFRSEGVSTPGVATLMRDAGLTHGGFYKHFASRDQLLAESLAEAFRDWTARLVETASQAPPGTAWKVLIKEYLGHDHINHPETGCPLAALAPELSRTDPQVKMQIAGAMKNYRDALLPYMPGRRPADRERAFYIIFSTMLGAIEMARLLPNREVRDQILSSTREHLLKSF